MERLPSPSQHSQRVRALFNFFKPASGSPAALARHISRYTTYLRQFDIDLQAMRGPDFHTTLRQIRRAAARCSWIETHKPASEADLGHLSATQISHLTTAPITKCTTADDDTRHPSAPPLHFLQQRHTAATAPHSGLIRRVRLLYGRSYTATVRLRFPSSANVLANSALCPHPACTATSEEETIEHLLLDCPYYAPARQQLQHALARQQPPLPLTLRTILNPPDSKGKRAYAALYDATERFLDCVTATRQQRNLPPLDNRPGPLPNPPPPAQQQQHHRQWWVIRPRTAPLALDTG